MGGIVNSRSGPSVALVALGLLFGSAFLCIKVLAEELTPMQIVAGRLGLAAVSVIVVLAIQRSVPRLSRGLLAGGTALALLDAVVPYALMAWAGGRIESSVGSVLVSSMPLFTALFAWALLPEERLSACKVAGLFVGFAGVAVIAGPEALDVRAGLSAAHVAVVGGAACYAAATVLSRRLLKSAQVVDLTAVKLVLGAAVAGALSLAVDGAPAAAPSGSGIAALVVLGVASTGLGRLAYLWLIGRAGSVRASLVTYVIPISGVALGWWVLGEQPSVATLAGLGLVVGGSASVMYGGRLAELGASARGHLDAISCAIAPGARCELQPSGA
jgi:drug/metabolite transporter (DMT)-like permease